MRRLITFCAATVLILAAGNAHADMINFDSLDDGEVSVIYTNQPSGIGADFNNDAWITGSLGPSFPTESGSKVIFNSSGYKIKVNAVGPEWLKAGGYVTGAENVTLTAYDSSDTILVNLSGPDSTGGNNIGSNMFLQFGAANIAYVIFSPDSSTSLFTIDNFTFIPVPVPAAVLLGMLGLSVAGMKLRRFT